MTRTDEWRQRATEGAAALAMAYGILRRARADAVACDEEFAAAEEAQQTIQAIAETVQEAAHDRIAGVVSRCLAAVFDDPYEFRIKFERARGRTEARLTFVRDGMEVSPLEASGGGVVDVAAFALRLSCLMLARPARRRVVVLDEPFRFVSAGYRERVRAMLEGLSKDLDVQFIMVTHIEELAVGHVINVDG